ncbi:MAG: M1 family metallopeptidase [Acidobacteriota bacterium]
MARIDPHSHFDPEQPLVRRLHWKVSADFDSHRLAGEARLFLAAPSEGPLDLDSDALDIREARDQRNRPVPFHLGDPDPVLGRRLRLDLPEGTTEVALRYATSPEAAALQWLSPEQTEGRAAPFLFSQCQPHHARSMVPCQDSPRVRITYRAEITVPEGMRPVMSAGDAEESPGPVPGTRTFAFEMPQPIPSYLLALAAGRLESRDLGPRSRIWAEPETVEAAAFEFAEIESMIAAAEGVFGPYEWDRYDMLVLPPSFPYGGMENPRLTFLTPTLLAGDRSLVAVVVHELAHSWTGNLVTNATMNDFWLNEGFTVWAERRILEVVRGGEAASLAWAIGQTGLDRSLERFGAASPYTRLKTDLWGVDPDSIYSEVPYEKGARLVALLERTAGRGVFDAFVRDYIERFRFTSITSEEFLAFLEERLPGPAAEVGVKEWVYGTGLPANAPRFASKALTAIESKAAAWADGVRPSKADAAAWTPAETLIYLQNLPRPLPEDDCALLDRTFGLTSQGNYEILVEWLSIAAVSDYAPAFPRIREVLGRVGRMKFLRPLYKALAASPRTRELARGTFETVKTRYHSLSRRVAEVEMAAYPEG